MTAMNEQVKARMDQRPDAATLAWWNSRFDECVDGYRGATHAMNRTHVEIADQTAEIKALHEITVGQAEALHETEAAIGKLQAEVTELLESREKERVAYSELKKLLEATP